MIFVDTGAFISRYIAKDQYHSLSIGFWNHVKLSGERLFTSNFVIDEALTYIARHANYSFAAEIGENIYISKCFTVLRPEMDDEIKAVRFFQKYADQKISFTDCISFVLMNRQKIRKVFSFDRHFEYAGYILFPDK